MSAPGLRVPHDRVTFLGHATTLIELGGARLLTDPVLRSRLVHLRRRTAAVTEDVQRGLDGVLISHLHNDHYDTRSVKLLERWTPIVVPRGGGRLARSHGFTDVREVVAGDELELSGVRVHVVPADHDDRRWPRGGPRAAPVGFVAERAGRRVYFAGDTDVFDGMAAIGDPGLDLALLPIWGWGPTIGPGHMDPERAAQAAALLRPRCGRPDPLGHALPGRTASLAPGAAQRAAASVRALGRGPRPRRRGARAAARRRSRPVGRSAVPARRAHRREDPGDEDAPGRAGAHRACAPRRGPRGTPRGARPC